MNEIVQKFREGQAEAIRRRHLERVRRTELEFLPPLLEIQETPPSPWQHRVLWTLLAILVVGIGWATLGKLAIVASAQGQFVPKGKVKVVQPLGSGTVKAILVHAGETVRKGQPLIELNPKVTSAEAEAARGQLDLAQRQRIRLEAQLGNPAAHPAGAGGPRVAPQGHLEDVLQQAEEQAHATELDAAKSRLAQVEAEIAAGQATLDSLKKSSAIVREQLRSAADLSAMGAISRDDYLQTQRQSIDLEGRLAAQQQDMRKLQAARDAARQGVEQVRARYRRDLLQSLERNTDTGLKLQAANTQAQRNLDLHWLRSPVDGIVQDVGVTSVGEVVSAGQKVVTVVPKGEPLEVEANLANQDIAFVHVGQEAMIKVAAFPFEQYGIIPGRVVQISPDAVPVSAVAGAGAVPAAGLVYRVRIRPERLVIPVHGRPVEMRPGMAVQADIETGRRSILSFFLDPFKRDISEGLTVR